VNRLSPFVMLALAAPALAGCSYYGPGSSGVISLGPGLDLSGYQTLALRAFDNRRGSFDPSGPVPAGYAINQPLAPLTLPWPYRIGGAVNEQSDYADWMFVAWLSHRTAEELDGADVDMLDPGDLFCVVPFRLPDDTHGIASHVDCVLAEVVPASP
jgi:hypothetical protein